MAQPPEPSGTSFLITSETLTQTGLLNELQKPRAAVVPGAKGAGLVCRRCVGYASPNNRAAVEIRLFRRKASDTSGNCCRGWRPPLLT